MGTSAGNTDGQAKINIRLLVADDHEVVRKGLCAILQEQEGWVVAAEANDGREAVSRAIEVKPDIAIMDIGMPVLNGLEATRQILRNIPRVKVLVLTVHDSDSVIREAIDAGAHGYLLKTDAGADLIHAVESLQSNKTFFTAKAAKILLEGYLPGNVAPKGKNDLLTHRQREILQLLAEGKSSREVALSLNLSVKTIETHRSNIMQRLDCHTVTELVRYAIRNHIIQP
jgi:DNA-binding NarL/FixJ family response regulator